MNETEEECPDCFGWGSYSSFDEYGGFEDSFICTTCDGEGVVRRVEDDDERS